MIEIIGEETLEERAKRRELQEEHSEPGNDGQPEEDKTFNLPKNIRQIGDAPEGTKVYIEDYVMTYIKQLGAYKTERDEAFILYGNKMVLFDTNYYFVSGAICVEAVKPSLGDVVFNHEDWKRINEKAAVYFPALSVLGWALLHGDDGDMLDCRITGTHEEYFRKDQEVFLNYCSSEKEEKIYLYKEGSMLEQKGHYIYYDKNEMMQNYMVSMKEEEEKVEEEHVDHAAKQFRRVVQEKKEQRRRHRANTLLYGTATVLAFVIVLIGITMLNNYEKMQSMERVLYQIASDTSDDNIEIEDEISIGSNLGTNTESDADDDVMTELGNEKMMDNRNQDADNQSTLPQSQETTDLSDNENDNTNNNSNMDSDHNSNNDENIIDTMAQTISVNSVVPNGDAKGVEADNETETSETVNQSETAEVTSEAVNEQIIKTTYQTYTIQRGDTLEKINQLFYGNVNRIDEICSLNNIKNKDNICYGEKIILP